jgi:hypothetical protein
MDFGVGSLEHPYVFKSSHLAKRDAFENTRFFVRFCALKDLMDSVHVDRAVLKFKSHYPMEFVVDFLEHIHLFMPSHVFKKLPWTNLHVPLLSFSFSKQHLLPRCPVRWVIPNSTVHCPMKPGLEFRKSLV